MPSELAVLLVWVAIIIICANSLIWFSFSVLRWARETPRNRSKLSVAQIARIPGPKDVAILVAAHNEEKGIARTVRSAHRHVPWGNVFVASDGSTDRTSEIARRSGANVVDVQPNRGKAGALEYAIQHFNLAERFEVVMLLDADTVLADDYLDTGLPQFVARDVVAVAGTARTAWDPKPSTKLGELFITHRERMYLVVQFLSKFGQASKYANAVNIVPGFASMYRTRILSEIDISAPGLVIEDFNMTFEVHAKRLGRIAFHPKAAHAFTQDPDSFQMYTKQVGRWSLGFWQTLHRHRRLPFTFGLFTWLFVLELTVTSLVILALPLLILASALILMNVVHVPDSVQHAAMFLPPWGLLLGYFLADMFVTIVAFCIDRRPEFLRWLLVLPLMRWLDAWLCVRSAFKSFKKGADGRWKSPTRR